MTPELSKLVIPAFLSGMVTSGGTTLRIRSGASWPTEESGTFRVQIDKEILRVRGISGSLSYTIVERAAESSTQSPHNDWAIALHVMTPQSVKNFTGSVNAQTGTSYTISTLDARALVTLNNAAAVAVTLPQATSGDSSSFGPHFWFTAMNLGAGAVTITPTTSTINGAATLVLQQNQSAVIYSDGTNYFATIVNASVFVSGIIQSGHIGSGAVQGYFGSTRNIASGTVGVFDFGSGAVIAGTVGSGAIQSGNVASGGIGQNHLASGLVNSGHIGNAAVVSGGVASGQIAWPHLSSGTVRSGHVADGAVNSGNIGSGAIAWVHLSSGAVRSGNVADGAVNSGNLGSGSVAWAHLSSGAVRSGHVANDAITSGNVSSGSIGQFHHASGSVTSGHIGNAAVVSGSIASGAIGPTHLASGLIQSGHIGSGAILGANASGARNIASGTIGIFDLGSGVVSSGHLANGSVVSGSIASGNIGRMHLSSGAINSGQLANASVVSGSIASGNVGQMHLSSGLVNSGHIANAAVVSGSLASGLVGQMHLSSGAINSGHLGNASVVSGSVASGAIGRMHLAAASVNSGHLTSGAFAVVAGAGVTVTVNTDNTVTIANASGGALVSGAVGSGFIASGAVQGFFGSTRHIASGTVGVFDFGSGAVVAGTVGSGAIVSGNTASGQIGFGHLANGSVQSGTVASGQIGRMHHASGAINSGHIADATVVSGSIASGNVAWAHLSSGAVRSGHVANDAITSGNISSGSVGRMHIAATAISSGHLISGAFAVVAGDGISITVNADNTTTVTNASGGGGASLTSGSVQSGMIASGAVQGFYGATRHIASGTIGNPDLGSGIISPLVATLFSGGTFPYLTAELISGVRGVYVTNSGTIAICKAASDATMPCVGIVATNVLSGLPANVIQFGAIQTTSGMVDFSGLNDGLSRRIMVGMSGQLSLENLSWNSGFAGFPLNAQIKQFIGVALNSGAVLVAAQPLTPLLKITTVPPIEMSGSIGYNTELILQIASGGITSTLLANNSVQSGAIASGQVAWPHISSGAIRSGHLANGSVVSGSIASGNVGQMHLSSGAVNSGHIGNAAVVSGSYASGSLWWTHVASGVLFPRGFVQGFKLTYLSSGTVVVSSGIALDKSGVTIMALTTPYYLTISGTLEWLTAGGSNNGGSGIGSLDILTIGPALWYANSTIVSGVVALSILWPVRTCPGNITISGTYVAGLSGSDLLSNVSINDLIGRSGTGFWRVTAVNSGTATVALSGSLISGAMQVIENALIAQSGRLSRRVNKIASGQTNGSIFIESNPDVSGSIVGFIGTNPNTVTNLNVWIGQGLSGVSAFLSTQRTTPFLTAMLGYAAAYRRVGSLISNSGLTFSNFSQFGTGQERMYQFYTGPTLLTAGATATWTDIVCSPWVPPTTNRIQSMFGANQPVATQGHYFRARNVTTDTGTTSFEVACITNSITYAPGCYILPDPAQVIQYRTLDTNGRAVYRVLGYDETLE